MRIPCLQCWDSKEDPLKVQPKAQAQPSSTEQSTLKTLASKVWGVVQGAFRALLGVAFCWMLPNIFAIGFVVGIIADKKIAQIAKNIGIIWKEQSIASCFAITAGCYFLLPATICFSTFLFAAEAGSDISRGAKELHAKRNRSEDERPQRMFGAATC